MKRDLDLLRNLMIYLEDNLKPNTPIQSTNILLYEGDDEYNIMSEHITMLLDMGYIECNKPIYPQGFKICSIIRITSNGYDFLDALRNDTTWNHVKAKASSLPGLTIGILLDLGKEYIKTKYLS